MIIIEDEAKIKSLISFLNANNQIMKNIYGSDGIYNYSKGTIIANHDKQLTPYVHAIPIYAKKDLPIQEMLANLTFSINGKEFFKFLDDYKNHITKIIFENNGFKFETDVPLLEYQQDYVELKYNKIYKTDKLELIGNFSLSDNDIDKIKEINNGVFSLYFDFDKEQVVLTEEPSLDNIKTNGSSKPASVENYLQLLFNKKFIVGYKNTKTVKSNIDFEIFDYDSDRSLYLINVITKLKKLEIHSKLLITDFGINK